MFVGIYFRNTVRLLGLLAVVVGAGVVGDQWWGVFSPATAPAVDLYALDRVPQWLAHASPVVQGLVGWPWVILAEVPLPLLLLLGGTLAMRV
jgi:hypothetical protein